MKLSSHHHHRPTDFGKLIQKFHRTQHLHCYVIGKNISDYCLLQLEDEIQRHVRFGAKRMAKMEAELSQLKHMYADLALKNREMKELSEKKLWGCLQHRIE